MIEISKRQFNKILEIVAQFNAIPVMEYNDGKMVNLIEQLTNLLDEIIEGFTDEG